MSHALNSVVQVDLYTQELSIRHNAVRFHTNRFS
jgi:hypothetical protein